VLAFEAQVRLPRVDGRPVSPRSMTFATREAAQAWHDKAVREHLREK
jgi:hypothetical protein